MYLINTGYFNIENKLHQQLSKTHICVYTRVVCYQTHDVQLFKIGNSMK